MRINEIAACTGIPSRQLRYVVDHGLLHGQPCPHAGRGSARHFTELEALGLALAAALHGAGLSREVVTSVLQQFVPFRGRVFPNDVAWIELADGKYARVGRRSTYRPQAWVSLVNGQPVKDVGMPLVLIRIDLNVLRHNLECFERLSGK